MNRLRYFCAVVQAGSLTEASKALRISQPALSKAIKLLESELECELIAPQGRGIIITDQGLEIAKKAKTILEQLEGLKNHEPQNKIKKIRVATFEVFSTYFLGDVIQQDFPEEAFDIHELLPGEMERAVLEKRADFGITYVPIPHPELEFIEITQISMSIFGRKNVFKNTEFSKLPFIIPIHPIKGTPSKVDGLDGWPDHKIPRFVKYQVGMLETGLSLARKGQAVIYLPDFVVDLHNETVPSKYQLDRFPKPKQLKKNRFSVYLLKRIGHSEDKTIQKVAKKLRKLK